MENKEEIDKKFLWLEVLHLIEDMEPKDNPATKHKTIKALFDKYDIEVRSKNDRKISPFQEIEIEKNAKEILKLCYDVASINNILSICDNTSSILKVSLIALEEILTTSDSIAFFIDHKSPGSDWVILLNEFNKALNSIDDLKSIIEHEKKTNTTIPDDVVTLSKTLSEDAHITFDNSLKISRDIKPM